MQIFPPLPPYEGAHPIVVHFPIGLLLTAPLFIIAAMLRPSWARGLFAVTLSLVTLGVAGAMLAVSTGEAAEDLAKATAGVDKLLHDHEEGAELARNLFLGMLLPLGIATFVPVKTGEKVRRGRVVVTALVLIALYAYPALTLVRASHLGARLVHERGVKAMITAPGGAHDSDPE